MMSDDAVVMEHCTGDKNGGVMKFGCKMSLWFSWYFCNVDVWW